MSATTIAVYRLRAIFNRPVLPRAAGEPSPEVDDAIDRSTRLALEAYHLARSFEEGVLPILSRDRDYLAEVGRMAMGMIRDDHPEWFA